MEDLDELILLQLKHINRDAGRFTTGILTDRISTDEQICFAHRLVDLAEAVRDRAISAAVQVVEGSVINERTHTDSAPPPPRG